MTIKDVENRTGLERASIRFYEKEGLLSPVRAENGYRDYSDSDVQILLRIKLLRRIRLTLEEIKALQSGELELTDALKAQIAELERERQDAGNAQELCSRMVEDRAVFRTLDAEKYLSQLPEPAGESLAADIEPQAFCPWRRFFARSLDLGVYGVAFRVGFCLLSGTPVARLSSIASVIAGMVIMLLLEPLLLRRFGTTLGKYCFGLSIEAADGRRLSYGEGFARTAGALCFGMAFQISLVRLYPLWKSYRRCVDNEIQPWERETPVNYSFRYGDGRCALNFAAVVTLAFLLLVVTAGVQMIPPNRGELTVAGFAENVNHAGKFYFEDVHLRLDEAGQWTDEDSGAFVINLFGNAAQELEYSMDGQAVAAVSFSAEGGGDTIVSLPYTEMALLAMGLAGSGNEAGFAPQTLPELGNQILRSGSDFADGETNEFYLSQYGVTVSWTLTQRGYHMSGGMLVSDNDDAEYFLSFRVERT